MLAIETKALAHTYRHHFWDRPKHALRGLDLKVEEGEIFGYLGSNGAGKTTTIKILVGLQRQTGGEASLFGIPVRSIDSRRQIGFQPENPYFYEYLTALESMLFYAALCDVPRSERRARSEELLEFVGMREAANARVGEFSKGMRQRLGIAQSLVHRPRLVILDEPMSGLDPVGRSQVREAILQLKQRGLTVFFSSHVLGDVELICDRVGLLQNGVLSACGPVDSLLETRENRIEVAAENLSAAMEKDLSATATRVVRQGERVLFVFDAREKADSAVEKILQQGGRLALYRLQRETLEEYFMRTTGRSRREVGAWSGGADR